MSLCLRRLDGWPVKQFSPHKSAFFHGRRWGGGGGEGSVTRKRPMFENIEGKKQRALWYGCCRPWNFVLDSLADVYGTWVRYRDRWYGLVHAGSVCVGFDDREVKAHQPAVLHSSLRRLSSIGGKS